MPLPLTVWCFSKIQIGFTFLVPAHSGSRGQRATERVYVCMYVSLSISLYYYIVYWAIQPLKAASVLNAISCQSEHKTTMLLASKASVRLQYSHLSGSSSKDQCPVWHCMTARHQQRIDHHHVERHSVVQVDQHLKPGNNRKWRQVASTGNGSQMPHLWWPHRK